MKHTVKHTENAQFAPSRSVPVWRQSKDISEVPEVHPGLDAPFEGASLTGAPQRPTMAPLGHASKRLVPTRVLRKRVQTHDGRTRGNVDSDGRQTRAFAKRVKTAGARMGCASIPPRPARGVLALYRREQVEQQVSQ